MNGRFLLFAGIFYYPNGGWDDFKGSYDTPAEAAKAVLTMKNDWWHAVDTKTGERWDHHDSCDYSIFSTKEGS
jgi:hypothetical protein